MAAIGRNEPCPCGSGLKYKRCCALKREKMPTASRVALALIVVVLIAGGIFMLLSLDEGGNGQLGPARVWHNDHWDYPGRSH